VPPVIKMRIAMPYNLQGEIMESWIVAVIRKLKFTT